MRLSVLLQFPCLVKRVGAKACERGKQRDHAAAAVPSMTADQGERARNGITCPDVTASGNTVAELVGKPELADLPETSELRGLEGSGGGQG